MTVKEIFDLRKQGRIEEAYEAIRPMYATHKGKYTTLCMFWTANDILKKRLLEEKHGEAVRIFRALLRLAPNIEDKDGRIHTAVLYDAVLMSHEVPTFRMLDFLAHWGVERLTDADWQYPPQPCLAHRLLESAIREIREAPTVDNALKAIPLLNEALRRNPQDGLSQTLQRIMEAIVAEAERKEKEEKEEKEAHGMSHNDFGRWGEELAADYLESKGYRILERDWRSGHRDIDIVARNAEAIVFVEVKTRRANDFGEPYEAVNYSKRRNLLHAINHYIHYKQLDLTPRFDIISIVASDLAKPEIEHIEDIRLS